MILRITVGGVISFFFLMEFVTSHLQVYQSEEGILFFFFLDRHVKGQSVVGCCETRGEGDFPG